MKLKFNFLQLMFLFHGFSEVKGPLDSFPCILVVLDNIFSKRPYLYKWKTAAALGWQGSLEGWKAEVEPHSAS